MGKIKYIWIFLSGFLMMAAFQNCGESLDLSQQEAASTAPSASISISSPSMVENGVYSINLNIQNIDTYIVQWFKDGVALEGFTGDILEFAPAQLSDAGDYYATVQISLETTYTTETISLTVTPDPTVQVVAFPFIRNNNNDYFLASSTDLINQQTGDAYCKTLSGPNAVATSITRNINSTNNTPNVEQINYTARYDAVCNGGTALNGLCLRFNPGEFEPGLGRIGPFVIRISSISCRPEPIEGL